MKAGDHVETKRTYRNGADGMLIWKGRRGIVQPPLGLDVIQVHFPAVEPQSTIWDAETQEWIPRNTLRLISPLVLLAECAEEG